MRHSQTGVVLPLRWAMVAVAAASVFPTASSSAETGDARKGQIVFGRFCVSCHGKGAQGDGPLASDLRVAVPDLTALAARNGGVFPADRVQQVIENGLPLRGHGTAVMPAWGDAFKRTQGIEARTPKEAIQNLTSYLRSLQGKPAK